MITTVVPDLQSRMLTQIVDINAPCSTTWEQQWVEQLCSIQRSSSEYNLIGRGATWTNCDSSVLEYKQHSAHTSRWIPRVNKYNRAHLLSCNCIHSDRTILWHWNCASLCDDAQASMTVLTYRATVAAPMAKTYALDSQEPWEGRWEWVVCVYVRLMAPMHLSLSAITWTRNLD